ncbi:unnamed protein product [Schistocephalus solidus]|uniref:BHLH domain-containing protein n=1 Tax=Schistocephalus solidus TaxID=70667 RepID=A0A183T571_SCHSO|nr:unnamed protein product [Schistocephalus solidus]
MREKARRACEARKQARDAKPAMRETFKVIKESIQALSTPKPSHQRAVVVAQMAAAAATKRAREAEEEAEGQMQHLLRDIRDSVFMLENRESTESSEDE